MVSPDRLRTPRRVTQVHKRGSRLLPSHGTLPTPGSVSQPDLISLATTPGLSAGRQKPEADLGPPSLTSLPRDSFRGLSRGQRDHRVLVAACVRAVCPTVQLEPETATPWAGPPGPELLKQPPRLSAPGSASASLEFADQIPSFGISVRLDWGPRTRISAQALGVSDVAGWRNKLF